MIDGERLWRRISELGEIGSQDEGGVTRLSFTDEERAAKDKVVSYMKEAGLSVREDAAGNLFGRREGRNPDSPSVLIGSHVDSVYNGGNFDGPLGVLAGIEVLHAMEEQRNRDRASRRGRRLHGRGGRALLIRHDREPRSGRQAHPGRPDGARGRRRRLHSGGDARVRARPRAHRRGGPSSRVCESLRRAAHRAGQGPGERGPPCRGRDRHSRPVWLRFSIEGETGHAGATPMSLRRDALAAAAEIVGLIEAEASATGTSVGTVGQIEPRAGRHQHHPGPGRVLARPQGHRRGSQGRGRRPHPGSGHEEICAQARCGARDRDAATARRPRRARSSSGTPWPGLARGLASELTRSPAAPGTTGCSSRSCARWA